MTAYNHMAINRVISSMANALSTTVSSKGTVAVKREALYIDENMTHAFRRLQQSSFLIRLAISV